jgi:DNA-binding MarR family transcriptional regulator
MTDVTRLAWKMANECTGLRLRKATRVVGKIYDDALRPSGLQLSQLPVMVAAFLFGEPGASMNQLADVLVLDRTTLTRSIKVLEAAGFLRVARSPTDARTRVILVTKAGERALEEALPLWERGYEQVRSALGKAAHAELDRRLDEVIALTPRQPAA